MIKIVYFILACLIIIYAHAMSNYGPFKLAMSKINSCKGPKRIDCTNNSATLLNETVVMYDMNVIEEIKDVQGNMFLISENKQRVRLQMKKLCDHPFWLTFMKMYINITNDCVILKGNYRMVVNVQEVAEKYYGGSFIYGKYIFRSVFYNNVCNFACSLLSMVVTPK